jgi:glutamate-1-semialdehyde 2,1-aminomutase
LVTLFTQEMLKRGYLAAASVYVSMAHTDEVIDNYLNVVDEVFSIIKAGVEQDSTDQLLETRVRSSSFTRLTK